MRWILGLALAGGLMLARGSDASAQDLNSFGDYPAGITTGSPYGFYPGGFGQNNVTYRTPRGYVVAPRVSYYSSGFYGGTPGATTYGPGVDVSAGSYSYPSGRYIAPYTYSPSYGTYRRGLFGRRNYR